MLLAGAQTKVVPDFGDPAVPLKSAGQLQGLKQDQTLAPQTPQDLFLACVPQPPYAPGCCEMIRNKKFSLWDHNQVSGLGRARSCSALNGTR